MADQFNSRISETKRELESLITTLSDVESTLSSASQEFGELTKSTESVAQLTSAVQKLSKFLGNSEKSPLLEQVRAQVRSVNDELDKISLSQVREVTSGLEANARALAAISRAQANLKTNIDHTREAIAGLKTAADSLDDAAPERLGETLRTITAHAERLQNMGGFTFVDSLNELDPGRYEQTADALGRIHSLLLAIKSANITLDLSAAGEADKLTRRPIQPVMKQPVVEVELPVNSRPRATPTVVRYAEQQGVSLSDVVGTGRQGNITNKDIDQFALTSSLREVEELRKNLDRELRSMRSNDVDLSVGSAFRAAGQVAIKSVTNKKDGDGISQDYFLNSVAGRRDRYTGVTGPAQPGDVRYDPITQSYSTKGNNVVGANDREFLANKEAIRRAVLESSTGIAVLATAGANVGGASAFTKTSTGNAGVDHIAVAFLDALTGEIRIREKNANVSNVAAGNKLGIAGLGNAQAAERSLDEFAASVDRVTAVTLNADQETARQFRSSFFDETETTARAYSFKRASDNFTEAGDTCASVFARVAKGAGLLEVQSHFASTPVIGKKVAEQFNIVTPADVLDSVQRRNALSNGVTELGTPRDFKFLDALKVRLREIFDSFSSRLKESFENLKGLTKDVTLGDIFSYARDLIRPQQPSAPATTSSESGDFAVGAAGIRTRVAQFSKDYYRPAQTGLTYFGAGLNSVQEITKGLQTGGPGGLLDVLGGSIKGLHTLSNANAYFNLGILPKGIGELFNQRRSDTLLDIAETFVGVKTGYRRSPIDRNLARLVQQEKPLEARKEGLKEAIASGNLTPEELLRAKLELAKVSEELRALRQAITAYRRVLAEEAKHTGTGGGSTGKKLSEEALKNVSIDEELPAPPPAPTPAPSTAKKTRKQKSTTPTTAPATAATPSPADAAEGLLSQHARSALEKFSENTGFSQALSGRVEVLNPTDFGKLLRDTHTKDQLDGVIPEKVVGVNLPQGAGLAINSSSSLPYASTFAHEGTHRLVNAVRGDRTFLSDETASIEPAAYTAKDAARAALYANELHSPYAKEVLTGYYKGGQEARDYYQRPNEQYAYVGQALLSGDKELESALRQIYGDKLFNSLAQDLKNSIPDTFGDEALGVLQKRFQDLDKRLNQIIGLGKAPDFAIAGNGRLAQLANNTPNLNPDEYSEQVRKYYGSTFDPNRLGGFSVPGTGKIYVNPAAAGTEADADQIKAHEATHILTYEDGLTNRSSFNNYDMEAMMRESGSKWNSGRYDQPIHDTGDRYANAARWQEQQDPAYIYNGDEAYAFVGQAIATGNKKLAQVLREIYGDKLFDKIAEDLRKIDFEGYGGGADFSVPTQARARLRDARGRFVSATQATTDTLAPVIQDVATNVVQSANAVVDDDSIAKLANAADSMVETLASAQSETAKVAGTAIKTGAGVVQGVDLSEIAGELKTAFREVFGSNLQQFSVRAVELSSEIPQYGEYLAKALSPDSANFTRIAQAATELYIPQGTPQRRLYSSFNEQGGAQLTQALVQAVQEPTKESFSKLFESAKRVDFQKIVEQYVSKIFTDGGLDLKGGLIATNLFKGGKITIPELVGSFATQFAPKDINFRDELNSVVRRSTGRNIESGSFSQQSVFDPTTGLQKFTVSAKTADGAVVSLNAHVDEFGKKIVDEPQGISKLRDAARDFVKAIPNQLADQFTYTIVDSFQQMFRQLVGVQDELAEVANLLGEVGDKATIAKSKFLFASVKTAVQTGQGFDEAIQTNLKNFKVLGSVSDPRLREKLANDISGVQLGAQTAFGISLEQGLESIPSILATIKDGMDDIADPTERVKASVGQLREVMDQVVVAQRATGAQGDELITVYSRLAGSAKEYGLNSKQLLGITATSSVAIGRGSDETSNILRAFLEGTYSEANQTQFNKAGIATKLFDSRKNQFENRSFESILKDLAALSRDSSRGIEYNQLLQSIAGPKLKPDIAKVVAGFATNYDPTYQQLGNTSAGTFDTLVGQKSQNFQGSINKLGATGTQLFGTALVGTGALDKLTDIIDNLADAALNLTVFLNDNEGAIKRVVNAIAPFITLFTSGALTRNLNVFAPLAKGLNVFSLAVEETKAKIVDFEAVGEGAPTGLTRTLRLALAVMKEMSEVSERAGQTITREFDKAASTVDRLNNASVKAQAQVASNLRTTATELDKQSQAARSKGPDFALQTSDGSSTPIKQRLALIALDKDRRNNEIASIEQKLKESAEAQRQKLANTIQSTAIGANTVAEVLENNVRATSTTPLSDRIRNRISNSASSTTANINSATGIVESIISPPQSRIDRLKGALEKPGAIAGQLVGPVAFDAIAGGFSKDNLTNIGAGIAGGIAGGIVGGPYGSIIGYGIAKSIAEYIDLPGAVGTSGKESETFAKALAKNIYGEITGGDSAPTAEDKATAGIRVESLSKDLGIAELKRNLQGTALSQAGTLLPLRALDGVLPGSGNLAAAFRNPDAGVSSSSQVRDYLKFQEENGGRAPGFLDNYNPRNKDTQATIGLFGENRDLLKLYSEAGVSNVGEFITLLDQAAKGAGPLAEEFAKLDQETRAQVDTQARLRQETELHIQQLSAQQLLESSQKKITDYTAERDAAYAVPYGLDRYNAFGSASMQLDAKLGAIDPNSSNASQRFDSLQKSQESLNTLAQTLQQLIPFAKDNGLNISGLETQLYRMGAQGQGQLVQRFQPAIEANRFVGNYEQNKDRLTTLLGSDYYKAKNPEVLKEVESLQKTLGLDKQRYDINKAFLALLKGQAGVLLDQADAIEKQNKTRQLISAGTPAQFTPASIFDTKGLSANQLNSAIQYALDKQRRLTALNPAYAKEFAKDQFLLQSGKDLKGVQGVNQGFVQEYLSQQNQQNAPIEDLSQYDAKQVDQIINQARALQKQAEALDPTRAGKYENDRILILRKNNEILSEVGLGQEFLRAALQANTKANEQLRGHFNLPSNYKAPTVWDYYANGGREQGNVNYPTSLANGMVPLSLAQQLAAEMGKGGGTKGADLSAVEGTVQPGSRPLFYPNPGSPAIYSEPEPIDLGEQERELQAALQKRFKNVADKYYDLQMRRIEKADKTPIPVETDIEDIRANRKTLRVTATSLPAAAPLSGPSAGTSTKLNTTITAFDSAIRIATAAFQGGSGGGIAQAVNESLTLLKTAFQNLDLNKLFKASNIVMQVAVNGVPVAASAVTVSVSNAGSSGASTLVAGPAIGSRRQ